MSFAELTSARRGAMIGAAAAAVAAAGLAISAGPASAERIGLYVTTSQAGPVHAVNDQSVAVPNGSVAGAVCPFTGGGANLSPVQVCYGMPYIPGATGLVSVSVTGVGYVALVSRP